VTADDLDVGRILAGAPRATRHVLDDARQRVARKQVQDHAVAEFGRQLDHARAQRREMDRQPPRHRLLAVAVTLQGLAAEARLLAGQHLAQQLHRFAHARERLRQLQTVPAFDDRVARSAQAQYEAPRRDLRDGGRGARQHRGRACVRWHHRDADAGTRGVLRDQRRQRQRIHAAGVREPQVVVARALGAARERQGVGDVAAQSGKCDGRAKTGRHGDSLLFMALWRESSRHGAALTARLGAPCR
jgi:hypothetical protein